VINSEIFSNYLVFFKIFERNSFFPNRISLILQTITNFESLEGVRSRSRVPTLERDSRASTLVPTSNIYYRYNNTLYLKPTNDLLKRLSRIYIYSWNRNLSFINFNTKAKSRLFDAYIWKMLNHYFLDRLFISFNI
jgi:hypothetical protein